MEKLLEYFGQNINRYPSKNPLLNAYFSILEAKGLEGKRFSVTQHRDLVEAEWQTDNELKKNEDTIIQKDMQYRSLPDGTVQIQLNSGNWHSIKIEALAPEVLRWLLLTSDTGKELCTTSPALQHTGLCNSAEKTPVTVPDTNKKSKDGLGVLPIVLIICLVLLACLGAGFALYKYVWLKAPNAVANPIDSNFLQWSKGAIISK